MNNEIKEKIEFHKKHNHELNLVLDNFVEARKILERGELETYSQYMDLGKLIHDMFDIRNKIESNNMFITFLEKDLKMQTAQKEAMVKEMNENYYKLASEARGILVGNIPEQNRKVIEQILKSYDKKNYQLYEYGLLKDVLSKTKNTLQVAK